MPGKSLGGLLAITASFLAGFVMTMILMAGTLVLADQTLDVLARIWNSRWIRNLRNQCRRPIFRKRNPQLA